MVLEEQTQSLTDGKLDGQKDGQGDNIMYFRSRSKPLQLLISSLEDKTMWFNHSIYLDFTELANLSLTDRQVLYQTEQY